MKLIKLISSNIAEPLTYIFNLSFSTGTLQFSKILDTFCFQDYFLFVIFMT